MVEVVPRRTAERRRGAFHRGVRNQGVVEECSRQTSKNYSVFNSRKIKYLLIGGYAVSLHAQPRGTKDLDLLVSPDAENAHALHAALAEFGAPLSGMLLKTLEDRPDAGESAQCRLVRHFANTFSYRTVAHAI